MKSNLNFFKSWLIYGVLSIFLALVGGAVVGAIIGFILGMAQVNTNMISITCSIMGGTLGAYVSFFLYKWSIKKYILPQVIQNIPKET